MILITIITFQQPTSNGTIIIELRVIEHIFFSIENRINYYLKYRYTIVKSYTTNIRIFVGNKLRYFYKHNPLKSGQNFGDQAEGRDTKKFYTT